MRMGYGNRSDARDLLRKILRDGEGLITSIGMLLEKAGEEFGRDRARDALADLLTAREVVSSEDGRPVLSAK